MTGHFYVSAAAMAGRCGDDARSMPTSMPFIIMAKRWHIAAAHRAFSPRNRSWHDYRLPCLRCYDIKASAFLSRADVDARGELTIAGADMKSRANAEGRLFLSLHAICGDGSYTIFSLDAGRRCWRRRSLISNMKMTICACAIFADAAYYAGKHRSLRRRRLVDNIIARRYQRITHDEPTPIYKMGNTDCIGQCGMRRRQHDGTGPACRLRGDTKAMMMPTAIGTGTRAARRRWHVIAHSRRVSRAACRPALSIGWRFSRGAALVQMDADKCRRIPPRCRAAVLR